MTEGRIELKSTQKTSIKATMENMTKNIAMASKTKKTIKSAAKSSVLAFMLSKEVKKQEYRFVLQNLYTSILFYSCILN